jgi:hypothetical protein
MKKHINIIVLIIVGLAAIAVLGYCFWQLQIEQKTFNWQKFAFIPRHTENSVDTSDWLTYRNEEYGFEFKYPKGWKEPLISFVNSSDPNKKSLFISIFRDDAGVSIKGTEIYGLQTKNDLNENLDMLKKAFKNDFSSSTKIELINGVVFYAVNPSRIYGEEPNALIVSKKYLLTLSILNHVNDDFGKLEELFKEVVSTFKFIN